MQWLHRRIHPTWLFTVTCAGIVAGIATAQLLQWNVIGLFACGVILVVMGFLFPRIAMVVVIFVGGMLMGLARGTWGQQDRIVYQDLYGRSVIIHGVVADDIDSLNGGRVRLSLGNIKLGTKSLPGGIFVTATGGKDAKRGDEVVVEGVLEKGFGNFPATIKGKITSIEREQGANIPREVRDSFADSIRRGIPDPEASLGIGYLLGQKNSLPPDLVSALKVTALTHVVVASGYSLTILVRIGRRIFARVSKYLATLTSVGLIVSFIAMTGLSPSMTRAGLISLLSLWAWYVGRKFHPVTLLMFAAALTATVNPSYVWGDLGWLLSFGAFAGVMIVAPILSAYFFGEKVPFVGQILIETTAAQLATLPIMIMAFEQLSVIGLLANLLVLPLVPLAMLLVALTGVGAMVLPNLAMYIGWPADFILSFQIKIIEWCADIPWAMARPHWGWWQLALYLVAAIIVLWYMKWRTKLKLYEASIIE